jgi:hypothetical protein
VVWDSSELLAKLRNVINGNDKVINTSDAEDDVGDFDDCDTVPF